MEQRILGRTGLRVSRLALGGLFVSSVGTDLDGAREAVRRAVDLGVNYVDTAPGYRDSEAVLGRILPDIDTPLILSTKLGGRPQPFDPRNRDALRASVEESLTLLRRDYIDMLMIHEPDRPGQYDWWTSWHPLAGPVLEVMLELKEQGIVGHLGLGGTTAYELAHIIRSGHFDVVLTAFNYSLLWREAEHEVLPAAGAQGMGVVVGSPLQQGALARCFRDQVEDPGVHWLSPARRNQLRELYALVDETGIPLPEMALRFVIANDAVDTVLMGARSAAEVEQNAAAVDKGPLPAELLSRLDRIAAAVPFRPFEEPFGIGGALHAGSNYRGPGPA